ncbi:SPOR domain-containing protein [Anderseniella sp. Alg231-50]|uniref:SPOR domain-containing protein n=1 Tax=Anderseniella sp. Alg231-50 TaxID=1922226 RepID=UPI000D54B8AF
MKVQLVVRASVLSAFLVAGVATNAVAAASKTIGVSSAAPAAIMQSAYTNLVSGKPTMAIAEYSVVISLEDIPLADKARALLNRALAHQKLAAHDAAIDDYSQAIELDALSAKTRAVALYNRGLAYSNSGRQSAAIDDYTNALYLDPYLAEAFYSRANALRESGQYDYALIDFARATKLNYPHKHLALYGKALTLAKLGHRDEATAVLFQAYSIKPDFAPVRERLADLGLDVPENPSERQIRLAVLPTQNLMADDIITGSTKAPSGAVTRIALREPVAPSANLTGGGEPNDAATTLASAKKPEAKVETIAAAVSLKSENPESISVEQVAAVPEIPAETTTKAITTAATTKAPEPVNVEPVAAPVQTANVNAADEASNVTAKLEGWTVQLVSQRQPDKAWDNWDSLKNRHNKLLRNKTAAVVRADVEGQGIYYRLRVHKLKKSQAKRLCRSLKRKGTGCFIARATG